MSIDLDAIRRRADAATPGPWTKAEDHKTVIGRNADTQCSCWAEEDAEFIAHARTDVPALLDEVERLLAALDELQLHPREIAKPSPVPCSEHKLIAGATTQRVAAVGTPGRAPGEGATKFVARYSKALKALGEEQRP